MSETDPLSPGLLPLMANVALCPRDTPLNKVLTRGNFHDFASYGSQPCCLEFSRPRLWSQGVGSFVIGAHWGPPVLAESERNFPLLLVVSLLLLLLLSFSLLGLSFT